VEVLPYIAYGLSLWAFATLAVAFFIARVTCGDPPMNANDFNIVFDIITLDLVRMFGVVLILTLYLIPVSFSLQLFLQVVDASGILNDC
jgi:hypothetical protein